MAATLDTRYAYVRGQLGFVFPAFLPQDNLPSAQDSKLSDVVHITNQILQVGAHKLELISSWWQVLLRLPFPEFFSMVLFDKSLKVRDHSKKISYKGNIGISRHLFEVSKTPF